MKIKLTKALTAITLSVGLLTACATAPKDAMVKVGKTYITEEKVNSEYDKLVERFTDDQKKTYDENTDEGKKNILNLKENILNSLSNAEIVKLKMEKLANQYKKDGKSEDEIKKLTVTDDEIDEQVKKIKEQIGGEDKFKEQLDKYKISEDELKSQLKDNALSQKFKTWFSENFKPSDDEVKEQYKGSEFEGPEITASHILVEKEEDAIKAKERIENGEDFEKVAKEVSKDPSVSKNSGSLGAFTKGVMVKEFYDAASNLEIGKVSDPVKSKFGYHIIKVTARVDNFDDFSDKGKEAIKSKLEQKILNDKFVKEFEKIKKEVGFKPIKSFKNDKK